MTASDFEKEILSLAKDDAIKPQELQEPIMSFFKGKAIPSLKSIQTFVVRCSVNNNGEVFKNTSRCSYPPDEHKKDIKLQRANYPGQQVFYCTMPSDTDFASASSTCVVETAWEHVEDLTSPRTYLTLSRWRTSRPLELWILPFSEKGCERNRDFYKIRENMKGFIYQYHQNPEEILKALTFISNSFCQRKDKLLYYKITSAFYNTLLTYENLMSKPYDGLIYPSANTESAGLNIVLKKELVDNKILFCDYATMMCMHRNPSNPKNLSILPASNDIIPETDGTLRFTSIF